jgi:hypothetical protein
VRSVRPGADGVFTTTLSLRGRQTLRAVQAGQLSLAWSAAAR